MNARLCRAGLVLMFPGTARFAAADDLHFRPDRYRYLVPIDLIGSDAAEDLHSGAHFRVFAALRI